MPRTRSTQQFAKKRNAPKHSEKININDDSKEKAQLILQDFIIKTRKNRANLVARRDEAKARIWNILALERAKLKDVLDMTVSEFLNSSPCTVDDELEVDSEFNIPEREPLQTLVEESGNASRTVRKTRTFKPPPSTIRRNRGVKATPRLDPRLPKTPAVGISRLESIRHSLSSSEALVIPLGSNRGTLYIDEETTPNELLNQDFKGINASIIEGYIKKLQAVAKAAKKS